MRKQSTNFPSLHSLLVRTDELVVDGTQSGLKMIVSDRLTRQFHFWFFGYVVKLPYERTADDSQFTVAW